MPLMQCFPDTNPANGGLQALSHVNKQNQCCQIKDNMELVKHIVSLHDGELRQVGEAVWELFPAPGGEHLDLFKAVFWHHQTITEAFEKPRSKAIAVSGERRLA